MTQQHPYTVMTVCTGNICRSPMAEIILRAEFESRGIGAVSYTHLTLPTICSV